MKHLFIPVVLFLLGFFVIGKNLDKPFVGIHDWNGARYGNIARNYLRYGIFTTGFTQIENSGVEESGNFKYYTHYPPLLPILISVSYRIFGVSERATRFIPVLVSAGLSAVIFLIGRTMFGYKIGLLASTLAYSTPMLRYFGKNPVHEPLALFFATLSFLGLAKVIKKDNGWPLIYLGVVLTTLTNWSSFFLVLAITFNLISQVPKRKILSLWVWMLIFVCLHFLQVYLATGSVLGGELYEALILRTGVGGGAFLTPFGFWDFINRLRLWTSTLFTISLVLTSFIGILVLVKGGANQQKIFVFATLIYTLGYPLAFPNASFIHNYFIYYLLLPLSILASFAVCFLLKNRYIWVTVSLGLILAVWFERASFVKALEKSSQDRLAFQVGSEIAREIAENDLILVKPYSFGVSRYPHLAFYSDRRITSDANSSYNWLIEVNEENGSYKILPRQ